MTLRAIIVDDELAAIKVLASLLADYEDIQLVGRYTDPESALENFSKDQPDVIFLDIEMGSLNGLAAADFFNNQRFVPIVFVTAYSQYAIDAFEVNAIDYLLKPVQEKRLKRTITKLRALRKNPGKEEGDKWLRLVSLDHPGLTNEAGKAVSWRTRKAKELFFYLWVNRQNPIHKDLILEKIFPDKESQKALALLHTTVYQVRNSLAAVGFPESVKYANESYQLKVPVVSDLEEVQSLLRRADRGQEQARTIFKLYRKDFLIEEDYPWANEIRIKVSNLVQRYIEGVARQELDRGSNPTYLIECLDFLNRLNPLDGPGVRLSLEYYAMLDKRAEMKDYYTSYKQRLARELKLKPPADIENLYQELMGS